MCSRDTGEVQVDVVSALQIQEPCELKPTERDSVCLPDSSDGDSCDEWPAAVPTAITPSEPQVADGMPSTLYGSTDDRLGFYEWRPADGGPVPPPAGPHLQELLSNIEEQPSYTPPCEHREDGVVDWFPSALPIAQEHVWSWQLSGPAEVCCGPHIPALFIQSEHVVHVDKPEDAAACDLMMITLRKGSHLECTMLVNRLVRVARAFALAPHGCRVLQVAIEFCRADALETLVKALKPHAKEMWRSPHGNFVLQKLVECLSPSRVSFIVDCLSQEPDVVAKHQCGCKVLERLSEHLGETNFGPLLDHLCCIALELSEHRNGNFVIGAILDHQSPERRNQIVQQMLPHIPSLAKKRASSYVILRALQNGGATEQKQILDALVGVGVQVGEPNLGEVADCKFGSRLLTELAERNDVGQIRAELMSNVSVLQVSVYGLSVLRSYGLM